MAPVLYGLTTKNGFSIFKSIKNGFSIFHFPILKFPLFFHFKG